MTISAKTDVVTPGSRDLIGFADGEFKNLNEILFTANTQALNYGTGIFEGIRAYWSAEEEDLYMFRATEHYERFLASARVLHFDPEQTVQDLVTITREVICRNGFRENIYIRPLLVKKALLPGERFGVKLRGLSAALSVAALPMGSYGASDETFSCWISRWRRVSRTAIPSEAKITGAYVNSALAYEDARDNGCDDAIMLNDEGEVTEATTANVFVVKDRTVLTPPLTSGILNGVTRRTVIDLCSHLGLKAEERTIRREDLESADECFLTATGLEIKRVARIGETTLLVVPDSVVTAIKNAYNCAVTYRLKAFSSWCEPIYGRSRC